MFIWNKSLAQLKNDLGFNEQLQKFGALDCYKHMVEFVPFDTGILSQNVEITADGQEGRIKFLQPYAHYQYTGNFNWNRTHHPLATNYWDKAMWAIYKDKITNEIDLYRKRFCK